MSRHWLALLLFGIWLGRVGVAHAAFNINPDPLNFPDVLVGGNTTTSTTLSANMGTNVTLLAVLHGGADCSQFSIVSPTGSFTVDNGTSQMVVIRFSPTSPGNKTCTIDLKDSPTNVFRSFDVNGKGIAPQIAITNPSPGRALSFGNADVGFTSNAMQVVAKNNGGATLNISSASITTGGTDFVVMNGSSPTTVPPTMSATWDIVCRPSAKGALTGNFRIMSDTLAAADKTIDINLDCTGDQASLATSMTSINFGNVQRGTTQMATFMLTNSGNVPVTGIMSMFGNAGLGYTFATPAPTTVAANTSETITVVFNPLNRNHGGPTSISFSGTWGNARTTAPPQVSVSGEDANFSVASAPLTLDFGNFRFDARDPKKTFTITNDGNAPLMITAPFLPNTGTLAAEYKIELAKGGAVLSPPFTINANDPPIIVTVTPQVNHRIGMVNGAIDVTSDAIGSVTEHIVVTGLATAANLNIPPAIEFGTVDISRPPPTQIITIQNTGNDVLDIMSLSITQADPAFLFKLPTTPAHITPNSALEIAVTYNPTATTDPGTPDMTILSIEIGGSLSATATVTITGEAVFTEVFGGGGCRTDAATSRASSNLLLGLILIGLLRRRRKLARHSLLAKPAGNSSRSIARGLLQQCCPGTSPTVAGNTRPRPQQNTFSSTSAFTLAIAVAVASLAITPTARADGIGIAVFEPTPTTIGTGFALQTPDVGSHGLWTANAVVSYASKLLFTDTSTGAGQTHNAPIERSTLMQIGGAYALLGRFELGAHMPLYQQNGQGADAAKGTARGNLALHAKARLWRGDLGPGVLTVGAGLVGVIPTASKGQFTGSDQPEGRLLALGAFTPSALNSRLSLSFNAGAVIRKEATYFNVAKKSAAAWGAGASYRILDALWATAELYGEVIPSGQRQVPMPGATTTMTTLSQIEWLAGLNIKPERRISVGLAIGRGLTRAFGTPDLRGVLSLSISPGAAPIAPIHPHTQPEPERDTDGDGVIDRLDRCPREPEDKDGFQDDDGCPDPDNDQDGVADAADRCSNVPETVNGIDDQDGCPEAPEAAAPDPAKLKLAEDTFTHGRELMQQGKYAEACAELARSQELDPQFGTQYNLAGCYVKLGKLASAWKLYREVAQSDTNATRRERATAQVTALAGRTSKLKLVLPRRPDGAQISLNGADASALIGSETPVDPGSYEVTVEAAGYRAWRKTVAITQEGKVVTIVIQLKPAK